MPCIPSKREKSTQRGSGGGSVVGKGENCKALKVKPRKIKKASGARVSFLLFLPSEHGFVCSTELFGVSSDHLASFSWVCVDFCTMLTIEPSCALSHAVELPQSSASLTVSLIFPGKY